ncbi:hypothetical protein PF005_g6170 [Phytophthora fragariae]|uniref:Uncharacterized protein n=1 Tax=Phytophthora fragariae TaxID=53985 RepID=A0A6A3TUM6_9STRA|nr:hypothetical protein PF003_g1429 [Phytophthora fragariae]KAE9110124.1 hypothetical protein PF010_g11276 [Phytophthora fragariae]KAE9124834.1 hypothetical protein PF007_g6566 [Phytophthora fragariae]KAE9142932.1 hypothetical protein PF006_g11996 [Phytophthora fragariae]KAE9223760.1 hypothetical protein PF005_g6170 [Phytophthora fragariae]
MYESLTRNPLPFRSGNPLVQPLLQFAVGQAALTAIKASSSSRCNSAIARSGRQLHPYGPPASNGADDSVSASKRVEALALDAGFILDENGELIRDAVTTT